MKFPASSAKKYLRDIVAAVSPRHNPALAMELKAARRHLLHSWTAWFFAVLIAAHACYGYWGCGQGGDWRNWGLDTLNGLMHIAPAGFITPYDFQFYFFHLCLYFGPLFYAMPDWTRRRRDGRLEELTCTALSRYQLLWAFILPWFLRIFAIIYLLYLTMLPWFNWWLLRFGDQCGNMNEFPKYHWTSWHCYITLQYFVTTLLFNLVAVVWVSLRRQGRAARVWSYLVVTVALDFLAYTICSCFYPPYTREGNNILIWLFTCFVPYFFNLSLLSAHSWGSFAAIFYPAKWALIAWMILSISHLLPRERWMRY